MNHKAHDDVNRSETKISNDLNLKLHSQEALPLWTLLKLNTNDGREFLCGWGAAVINVAVTYPINKIIFRQVTVIQ